MRNVEKTAADAFYATFKPGEEIVVETRDGMFHWGRMRTTDDVLQLTKPGGWSKDIPWDDIEFVCHDGFPVAHIFGMTAEDAQERANQTPRQLIHDYLDDIVRPIYGGCPWVAEGSLVEILNVGSTSEDANCETIILANGDARFHSWSTDHLFLEA